MLITLRKKSVAQKRKTGGRERKKADRESLELLASGCPWRQDFRGELSCVRSVASGCRERAKLYIWVK